MPQLFCLDQPNGIRLAVLPLPRVLLVGREVVGAPGDSGEAGSGVHAAGDGRNVIGGVRDDGARLSVEGDCNGDHSGRGAPNCWW